MLLLFGVLVQSLVDTDCFSLTMLLSLTVVRIIAANLQKCIGNFVSDTSCKVKVAHQCSNVSFSSVSGEARTEVFLAQIEVILNV